ncbi:MAG: two-component system sensor histidine kinase NtrB [Chloroflexota bacterium]
MADINNNLLALGRRVEYTQQLVDINQVVNQAITQMASRFENVTMVVELASDLPRVKGSFSQLRRVITNLITNGCEAMEGVGLLTVRTEQVRPDSPSNGFNRNEAGEYIKVAVSDNGCGVPANIRDKIFEPFFSTKTDSERLGMGLGLCIVQAIVEDHYGYIDLTTDVGKGSTFTVYIPIVEEF